MRRLGARSGWHHFFHVAPADGVRRDSIGKSLNRCGARHTYIIRDHLGTGPCSTNATVHHHMRQSFWAPWHEPTKRPGEQKESPSGSAVASVVQRALATSHVILWTSAA